MLNPLTFYQKNKKRSVAILIILLLSVFCISFITTIIKSVYHTCAEVNVSPFKCFSIVVAKEPDVKQQELETMSSVDNVMEGFTLNTTVSTVFGTTNCYIVFSDKIKEIFNLCNFTLSKGHMPNRDSNEIVVHESILRNKKLKVGDDMGELKIVGSYNGRSKLSFGCLSKEKKTTYAEGITSYILFSKTDSLEQMNNQLSKLSDERWEKYTYSEALQTLNKEFSTINLILFIVVLMVSACLSIAMAALVYTIYSNRYDEFAIMNAIGYRKRDIKRLIFQETVIMSLVAWLLGYVLSIGALVLTDKLIYADMGQSMDILTIEGVLYTLLIPVLVVLCTTLPSIRKLSKTDLITIIERR